MRSSACGCRIANRTSRPSIPCPSRLRAGAFASSISLPRTRIVGSSSASMSDRMSESLPTISCLVPKPTVSTMIGKRMAPSPERRGGRLSGRGEREAERRLEDELPKQTDLAVTAVVETADCAVRGRDEAVVRSLALVDEGKVERSDRFIVDPGIEIIVASSAASAGEHDLGRPHPIIAAEHRNLWREGKRAERRPAMRLVVWRDRRWKRVRSGGDVVPVLRPEIFDACADPLVCVNRECIPTFSAMVHV